VQDAIEGKLEKRAKGVFAPVGGKRLVAFIDDLNMPAKSKFGFIPPLELLKLWVDNGFWWVAHPSSNCHASWPEALLAVLSACPPVEPVDRLLLL
jgi:hypothetical protein